LERWIELRFTTSRTIHSVDRNGFDRIRDFVLERKRRGVGDSHPHHRFSNSQICRRVSQIQDQLVESHESTEISSQHNGRYRYKKPMADGMI